MGVQTMKEQNTFNARNKLGRASDDDGQQVLASRGGRSFSAAAAPFCHETDAFVVASDKTGAMLRTDNGVRAWRFKTQQLRTYLEGLTRSSRLVARRATSMTIVLSKMIMNKTTSGGSMFAPV